MLKNTELDYISTHTEIHCDEHKSNYTFITFTQKCFLDPTKRFYSQVQNLQKLRAYHSHRFAHSHLPYS